MTTPLVIVGTGLFAEVAAAYFEEYTPYRVAAFACDASYRTSDQVFGRPLHDLERLQVEFPVADYHVFVAIGYRHMNRIRQRVYDEIAAKGYRVASFVHPSVKIWSSTTLGDHVFILEDNTIQPFTSIGSNTVLWSGNHVGHHSRIGQHCFITSHVMVAGACTVGDNVFMGVNATLHDSLTIGDACLIGAGAVISKPTLPGQVFVPVATSLFPKTSDQLNF